MMTRKDYISTAGILKEAISFAKENSPENSQALYHSIESIQFVAEQFADLFSNDNPNFNEDTFFKAVHL